MTQLTTSEYASARAAFVAAASSIPGATVREHMQCDCRHSHGEQLRHPDPAREYDYLTLHVLASPVTAPEIVRDLLRVALAVDGYLTVNMPFPRGSSAPVQLQVSVAGPVEALPPKRPVTVDDCTWTAVVV